MTSDAVSAAMDAVREEMLDGLEHERSNRTTTYVTSPIKRDRATAAEMLDRETKLYNLVQEMEPMTVRQVFYQASVRGWVEKSEAGYSKVQRSLVELRRRGWMPYHWIADNTRWQRKPRSFRDPADALRETARLYRKSLWIDAEAHVEVWLEKDALASVIYDVTADFDVPLMVTRGYSSLSFLYAAAEAISEIDRPTYIYHLGDFDPSGVDAANKIEQTLMDFAPDADIRFTRLAVLPTQIEAWALPTRPTKTSDSRAPGFGPISVELDAIEPRQLRDLVSQAIEQHLDEEQYRVLRVAEESEREILTAWAAGTRETPQ